MFIFRRTNCIITASGIVTLCKRLYSMPDENRRVCGKNLNIVSMCAMSPVVHTSNISSCQKKSFFSFPVAVNNSIKVGPLVFLS